MLQNCFLDFAVEQWFGCRATESGFAEDIGAIEVWLIDWLIDWLIRRIPSDSNSNEFENFDAYSSRPMPDCL